MIRKQDYPNYYIAGDSASLKAQSAYVNFVRWDLILMTVSTTISIYNYQSLNSKTAVYEISALLLVSALLVSVVLKLKRYEDTWYRGRALAESCKTLTWRYVMCSEYFEHSLNVQEAEKRFIERIREIHSEFVDLHDQLSASNLALPIITDEMIRLRQLGVVERRQYYLNNRIQDQITWYSKKADTNKTKYEAWFIAVISCQFLALLSIVYLIKYPLSNFNFVGLFSTIAASGFSWLQLKKYQENKQAYTTATSELNLIKTESNRDFSDDEFSKYVLDSENAMSREHTMWLAQKRL